MKKILITFIKLFHTHIDRKIISYGICVIIAVILWFLNALNKEYINEISYPVRYADLPKGKYLSSDLPQNITLEVKAKGFALLGHYIRTSFLPITISFGNYHLNNNTSEYNLRTNDIRDRIASQISSEIKLLNIKPEEIVFRFSPSTTRKIAVQANVDYTLKPQYILKSPIRCIPDSIQAEGPASIIDTLRFIPTTLWEAGEIGKDISRTLRIQPIQGIQINDSQVKVFFEIERFTEARKTIPLEVRKLPESMQIRLFPASVNITYEIGLSKYDLVDEKDFRFAVDYDPQASSYLTVYPVKYPSFIKDLKYTPQKVEFILEKK